MSDKALWVDRTWHTGLPDEQFEPAVERLAGAPDRIAGAIGDVPEHDDHHIARIEQLVRLAGGTRP